MGKTKIDWADHKIGNRIVEKRGYVIVRCPTHPFCADPFGIHGSEMVTAIEVGHKILKIDGENDDWENLQGLCKSCLQREGMEYGKRAGKRAGFYDQGGESTGPPARV